MKLPIKLALIGTVASMSYSTSFAGDMESAIVGVSGLLSGMTEKMRDNWSDQQALQVSCNEIKGVDADSTAPLLASIACDNATGVAVITLDTTTNQSAIPEAMSGAKFTFSPQWQPVQSQSEKEAGTEHAIRPFAARLEGAATVGTTTQSLSGVAGWKCAYQAKTDYANVVRAKQGSPGETESVNLFTVYDENGLLGKNCTTFPTPFTAL